MTKARIKTETELEQFTILQSKVDSLVDEKRKTDVDFSDAPDEFRGKELCILNIIHFILKIMHNYTPVDIKHFVLITE